MFAGHHVIVAALLPTHAPLFTQVCDVPTMEGKKASSSSSTEVMEGIEKPRKIPILFMFLVDCQLDGNKYGIWQVMMESVLESYDHAKFAIGHTPIERQRSCLGP